MEEREYNNIYAIPANYTDSGKILGGMLELRNAVEAGAIVLLVGYPELKLITIAGTIKIVLMTVTLIPLAVVAMMGTAEYFSTRSGDMSIYVDSTMTVRKTIAVAQVIPQYRETQGQGRRKLLTPDEVLRLPNDELLCIIRGYNMLKLRKLDYTRHPYSKKNQASFDYGL